MAFLWFMAVVLFAGAVSAAPSRIVGGNETTIEQYPSIVQVDFFYDNAWGQSCAGNILTSRTILSAGHCFFGEDFHPSLRRIRAGTTYRNTGGFIAYVMRALNHPTLGQDIGLNGDVSVVWLSSPLHYGTGIQQVPIAPQGTVLPDNLPVVHAGWGATESEGDPSPVLRDVTIHTVNHTVCQERYDTLELPITESMMCAGVLDVGGKDACQGDSGGPLYFGAQKNLVGVISWGWGCAEPFYPGVSASVGYYSDWIVANAI